MDNNKKEENSDGIVVEDPETVMRVAQNIIEPALQEALKKARDEASVEVAKRMALQSAHIFRVHNVKMHGELLQSPPHKSHT